MTDKLLVNNKFVWVVWVMHKVNKVYCVANQGKPQLQATHFLTQGGAAEYTEAIMLSGRQCVNSRTTMQLLVPEGKKLHQGNFLPVCMAYALSLCVASINQQANGYIGRATLQYVISNCQNI